MSESQSSAKSRNKLTVDEKCNIARRKVSTGDSDEKVAAWFSQISGKHICRTVVGKAVRAGFHDLSPYEPDKNRCRRRAPMWPLLDEGLFSWFKSVLERNGMLSDALMLSKASELAMHLQINRRGAVASISASSGVIPLTSGDTGATQFTPLTSAATPSAVTQTSAATPPSPVTQASAATPPSPVTQTSAATPPSPVTSTSAATPPSAATPQSSLPSTSSANIMLDDDHTADGLSHGWLAKWKKRHGVFSVHLHGEAGGADQQGVARAQRELPDILSHYRPDDIFNFDETGLYYRQAPDRTLTTTTDVRGFKKVKDRITVGLAVNVCGTERLKPIVIHKYKRPRCFGNSFNPDIVVSYYYNKKAWMRSEVFTDWSKKVNEQFLSQQRNCVMLLDNASSHGVADTLLTKPLDQGIIAAFKAHYKGKLARYMVQQYDIDSSQDLQALSLKTNLKQAIIWLVAAWQELSVTTILNCWCKSGVLPGTWISQMRPDRAAMMAADAGESSQLREIAAVITRLPVEPGVTRMAAGDWVMDPGEMETEGEETMAEVATRLLGQTTSFTSLDVDELETQDPNNEEPQSVSLAEAKDSVSSLLQFVGDNIGIFSEEDFSHLVYLQDKMQSNVFDA
eukprot:Em0012g272a